MNIYFQEEEEEEEGRKEEGLKGGGGEEFFFYFYCFHNFNDRRKIAEMWFVSRFFTFLLFVLFFPLFLFRFLDIPGECEL